MCFCYNTRQQYQICFFQDSAVLEREFVELRDEAILKLDQSEQDLEAALDIRNRSLTVQKLTQQQLLDVESKNEPLLVQQAMQMHECIIEKLETVQSYS